MKNVVYSMIHQCIFWTHQEQKTVNVKSVKVHGLRICCTCTPLSNKDQSTLCLAFYLRQLFPSINFHPSPHLAHLLLPTTNNLLYFYKHFHIALSNHNKGILHKREGLSPLTRISNQKGPISMAAMLEQEILSCSAIHGTMVPEVGRQGVDVILFFIF